MTDDSQIVGDEKVGKTQLLLQIFQKIQNLGLHRDIEGTDRFITDNELRMKGNRAGNVDPLPLASAELMGETVHCVLRVQSHQFQEISNLVFPFVS
jgi:hypothetical protein